MKQIVDLFCGAGGTSTGILKACGGEAGLIAVNHWKTAINTHSLNHPGVRHICEPVENIHPLDLIKSGHLDMLAASCECRFHSNARGGGPCNEQSRSQPWQLVRWATDLNIDTILVENVREFKQWGPLNRRTRRPIKSRRGKFFRAFVEALANLGYNVEFRVQCAADFGDATTRERLILMADKRGAVQWPEPTHGKGRAMPWRSARGIIDWSIKGESVFKRAKGPLCDNTMERIVNGWIKYNLQPFLIMHNGTTPGHLKRSNRSCDEPLPTITTNSKIRLIQPFIVTNAHGTSGRRNNSGRARSVEQPLPTITTKRSHLLIEPFFIQTDQTGGNGKCHRHIDEPLYSVVTKQNMGLCQPFLIKYYGSGANACSVDEPLHTVTTKDRFALIQPRTGKTVCEIDFLYRLLEPRELAAAHSFPADYRFTGRKTDQTKQIGNSVPVELAAAHAKTLLETNVQFK